MAAMFSRENWRWFIDHPVTEWTIFAIGVILLLISPLVGVIPGPGGIIVAGIGLALILKTSLWARRYYVKFKRWQPKAGRWADWALRRQSAKRREALRKERAVDAPPIGTPTKDAPMSEILGSTVDPRPKAKPGD